VNSEREVNERQPPVSPGDLARTLEAAQDAERSAMGELYARALRGLVPIDDKRVVTAARLLGRSAADVVADAKLLAEWDRAHDAAEREYAAQIAATRAREEVHKLREQATAALDALRVEWDRKLAPALKAAAQTSAEAAVLDRLARQAPSLQRQWAGLVLAREVPAPHRDPAPPAVLTREDRLAELRGHVRQTAAPDRHWLDDQLKAHGEPPLSDPEYATFPQTTGLRVDSRVAVY
jgi:hypothetical protein